MTSILKSILLLSVVALLAQCRATTGTDTGDIPAAPDYADTTQWYVSDRQAAVDVFYIISTETGDYPLPNGHICHYADTHNDSTRAPLYGEMLGVDTLVSGQLNYYSPYYRQCSLQSFADDNTSRERYPLALDDVRRAFEYYLKHLNHGRPFILAGFSQGARIMLDLMAEMDDATFGQMIAAYAIGATITREMLAANRRIVPAQSASDTGVTICYNSVRDTSCAMHSGNTVGINPVNWVTDATPATLITEHSPLVPVDKQRKDTLTVSLDTTASLVIVEGYTATDYRLPLIGKEGNYHTREIWLYRDQLRDNMALRASQWLRRSQ